MLSQDITGSLITCAATVG